MEHSLRIRDIFNLAAPDSWAASVMPSILALIISYRIAGQLKADMAICLFLTAILMQSSVNALNDYADFVKGTDILENSPDASDAVIVYGLNPKTARNLGITFLVLAFVPGIYTVYRCGWVPLVIGLIGALVVVLYSLGKIPISYLPVGELISGFVMGGLITLAGVYMLTNVLDIRVLLLALPVIIGIGMIMFSNNGCDIERDIQAGRRTLPCILGKERTTICYRLMLLIWSLSPILLLALFVGRFGILIYLLECPVFAARLGRQLTTPLGGKTRGMIMGGITGLGIMIEFAYYVALLTGS